LPSIDLMDFTPSSNRLSRRLWLAGAALAGAGLGLFAGRGRVLAQPQGEAPILQPVAPEPQAFMARALAMRSAAEAAGDQPYGAVVVQRGRIVGEAPSAVVTASDPTAHAEMQAIRDAARRLGRRDLAGATLYSSSRPCAMCEAAAYWAGIGRMVHGTGLADAGAPRLSRC
jgi:tRNA(Arg) A34 adenosine deaminase TadA